MALSWAVLTLLLLAACSMQLGAAFKCYSCQQPTIISSCRKITYCKPVDTACKTTMVNVPSEYPFNGKAMVTGSCASSCEATDPDSLGAFNPVFCCFHDLCNAEKALGVRRSSRQGSVATTSGPHELTQDWASHKHLKRTYLAPAAVPATPCRSRQEPAQGLTGSLMQGRGQIFEVKPTPNLYFQQRQQGGRAAHWGPTGPT
ncbi:PREDICTED: secreted Ly-6/uPAR-related protein 1 [Elephantulus edwardii]|uniref:secreted Ly-6/uPAR-related protein 1 n=1 Tax=Elephantulus edwardii TaxID=28737 RepID=UPI0003F0837C|nr:PREDICTED: secreted Ly-6/uPAR-related protein 1 [Elephantulus edwardii]